MDLDDAISSGAQALFGEKYEDEVRVLSMGDKSFSVELCGGTHIKRTGDVGVFVITSQSSVASGVRRIEALGGKKALEHINEIRNVNDSLQQKLNVPSDAMLEKVEALIEENKRLKKSGAAPVKSAEVVLSESHEINDWVLHVEQVSIQDNKLLRGMVDNKKTSISKGCIILLNAIGDKVAVVAGVTDNLTKDISAKDIVSLLCEQLNGKGGGRPDFAQGAGETKNINEFVTSILNSVKSIAN
jgi:alanyl-tRNA synthetase